MTNSIPGWSDPAWADPQISLIADGCCGNFMRFTTNLAAGGTFTGRYRKTQWINVSANTIYTLNVCGRRNGNSTSLAIAEEYSTGAWRNGHGFYFTSSSWGCQQMPFTTGSDTNQLAVGFFLGTNGGTSAEPSTNFDIDNVMILSGNTNPIASYTPTKWGVFTCDANCCPNTVGTMNWGDTCSSGIHNGIMCQKTYKIYMGNSPTSLWNVTTTPTNPIILAGGTSDPVTSYALSGLTGGTYYWAVCALNANVTSGVTPACSEVRSFTVQNTPPAAPTLSSPANGADLTNNVFTYQWTHSGVWGNYAGGNTNAFYRFYRVNSASYNLASTDCGGSTALSCSPPNTINWGDTIHWFVRASNNGNNFTDVNTYADSAEWSFTATHGPWFQVVGGNVYAGGSVSTQIPKDTCAEPACKPYLMINDATSLYHGIVNYGVGLNLGTFCPPYPSTCIPTYIGEAGTYNVPDWRVNHTYGGATYNYDWWVSHFIDETKYPFTGGSMSGLVSGRIYEMSGSSLSGSVGTNKIIILKSGDITIDGAINVDPGGFLMVVASGTITIADSLGGTSAEGAVQGIFIANSLNFGAGAVHLFAEGTYIGWSSIDMGTRALIDNSATPVMTFKLRPDFLINAPDTIKKVYYPKWQQEPG